MGKLLGMGIILLSFFCGVCFGGDLSLKNGKPIENKGDLKAAAGNITVERNDEKEDLYLEPDVEDMLEEIDLLSELDYELLNELYPDTAKSIIK